MPKCFYCEKEGIEERRIPVDVEADCDLDETGKEIWFSRTIYSKEYLCQEHLQDYDEGIISHGEED